MQERLPIYPCGSKGLVELSPDGGAPDSFSRNHIWLPIPVPRPGTVVIHSHTNSNNIWVSGIAFGKNIWGHAKVSALSFRWASNGGTAINWNSDNWNDDILAMIPPGQISDLKVPVVSNGKDKIFYIIEHNNTWNGLYHSLIYANGVLIERLRTSYINPFAAHYGFKLYSRYAAAKIPKELINAGDYLVTIRIDMTNQNENLCIREAGTHDFIIR